VTTKDILGAVRESTDDLPNKTFKIEEQEQADFSHINLSTSLIFRQLSL
jgi:hypothetical protein